jgi:peptide/nickel transport system permease protein
VAYVARRLLAVAVVVVVTPTLTFVIFGSLRDGVSLWSQIAAVPQYISDTFLHLRLGYAGEYHKQLSTVVREGLPVDVALLIGGLVIGVGLGMVTGLISAVRNRSALDRALAIGSAAALSVPVYWFGFLVLTFFSPQSGYLVQLPFLSWYGGYVPFGHNPLRWFQALWVPWLAVAAPMAAMCHRMTRASLRDTVTEDFVRTARAKGLRERTVMGRHALRAAMPPVIGLVSVNIALLVGNVILIEPAFNLPGFFRHADIGQFRGEQSHVPGNDIIQALVIEASFLIAITMFLADVVRARLDPRAAARS